MMKKGIFAFNGPNDSNASEDIEVDVTGVAPKKKVQVPFKPRKRPSVSGYYGVFVSGNKWAARLYLAGKGGKTEHIGLFLTKERAAQAHDHGMRQLYGNNVENLNFETEEEAAATVAEADMREGPDPVLVEYQQVLKLQMFMVSGFFISFCYFHNYLASPSFATCLSRASCLGEEFCM